MCIPKYYISPTDLPVELMPAQPLDVTGFFRPYEGAASLHNSTATLLFAPNTSDVVQLMEVFAQGVACPLIKEKKLPFSSAFPSYFAPVQPDFWDCYEPAHCRRKSRCWRKLFGSQLLGFGSEAEAVDYAAQHPQTVDALLVFDSLDTAEVRYTIRMNHTHMPSTRELLNPFDLIPDGAYRGYWFFANLQAAVDAAIIGRAAGAGQPAPIQLMFKPFPWPAVEVDLGAGGAAVAFNLLLVFAFLAPTRAAVTAIVREKELRLREGMRILGLKGGAYWASWALTHFSVMAASGVLCAAISTYPFRHSDPLLMAAFFLLLACALISFAYLLSTLFSKSRVAGTATAMLYALAMIPGWLAPSLQQYGGPAWGWACLLPPSCVSLFAHALLRLETAGRGVRWGTLGLPLTAQSDFSAGFVFRMLALDTLLYAALTWYLDKVLPSEFGTQLPPYFLLLPSFWRGPDRPSKKELLANSRLLANSIGEESEVAVHISGLRKTFATTDGTQKHAVDGLTMDIYRGEITALLGHNGAGKTTTISMLTGMLRADGGEALIGGRSIRAEMAAIRGNLGVCPQFDILWPDITVREHLHLYAALKGFRGADKAATALRAAQQVGLSDKLETPAGDLSGGQRRKLSVAIAFLGAPDVVFLDEPTSGMDPYSRRFTWDIIRRHRGSAAIVLTSHSMEEADVLADRIAIMADGRLAALGTPLQLKHRYGVGYTLTIVRGLPDGADQPPQSPERPHSPGSSQGGSGGPRSESPSRTAQGTGPAADSKLEACVERHVAGAALVSRAGAEVAFRLPREEAAKFPALLRELQARGPALRVASYGLSVTTLEEVFLNVSAGAAAGTAPDLTTPPPEAKPSGGEPLVGEFSNGAAAKDGEEKANGGAGETRVDVGDGEGGYAGDVAWGVPLQEPEEPERLQGGALYLAQFRALLAKRALCAARDRMAVVTQLAVPICLVLLALLAGRATSSLPQEPVLSMDRHTVLFDSQLPVGASAQARNQSKALAGLLAGFPQDAVRDSGETKLWKGPFLSPANGTFDGWLLDNWGSGEPFYDAIFVDQLPANTQEAMEHGIQLTVLANQTALHALPAAIGQASTAIMRAVMRQPEASIQLSSHPLPPLPDEVSIRVAELSGNLLLVLCVTMAASVLSASFAVFLVRERECNSKHVQVVSGAPASAFWAANYCWDLLNFSLPAAGIMACFLLFDLPQFRGERMAALALLLWLFGLACLPLTYATHFAFNDEMRALQRLSTAGFLLGFLGFLATFLLDVIAQVLAGVPDQAFRVTSVKASSQAARHALTAVSPHFCLARGVYEIAAAYKEDQGEPNGNPFAWDDGIAWFCVWLCLQALAYSVATMFIEQAWLGMAADWARRCGRQLWHAGLQEYQRLRAGPDSPAGEGQEEDGPADEDEDVASERRALQQAGPECGWGWQVLLEGVQKRYSRGPLRAPLQAVAGLWVGVREGECFGLLGTNGAGKTTTFKMLTGELRPDEGDALVCGHSVRRALAAARQHLGYCPQFDALPGAMTGREVVRMYARLRGTPLGRLEAEADHLLTRLGLAQYADRACETYSGGNRRKLSVAVALVGAPPVVLMDEPSTGMDPGARRFLWGIIQKEVIEAGHTVVLTSHSMEECEALCTRIGILTAGHLRCLGTVQHLKNRFGAGYLLEMRLQQPDRAEEAVASIQAACPAAHLAASTSGRLSFTIPQAGLDLPALFEAVEAARGAVGVEEYSISQTTLEQVFIALAREQGPGPDEHAS